MTFSTWAMCSFGTQDMLLKSMKHRLGCLHLQRPEILSERLTYVSMVIQSPFVIPTWKTRPDCLLISLDEQQILLSFSIELIVVRVESIEQVFSFLMNLTRLYGVIVSMTTLVLSTFFTHFLLQQNNLLMNQLLNLDHLLATQCRYHRHYSTQQSRTVP